MSYDRQLFKSCEFKGDDFYYKKIPFYFKNQDEMIDKNTAGPKCYYSRS